MDDEVQLISDDDGLAVIGDPEVVERFLVSEGLSSKDRGLPRLGTVLNTGAAAAQAGSEIAANSGRWVKLTKESAQLVDKYGLRKSSKTGLSTGAGQALQRDRRASAPSTKWRGRGTRRDACHRTPGGWVMTMIMAR